jgi:hypothetical protein
MNEEQEHDAKQRQFSLAGLLVAFFMMLMAGIALLAVVNLWPIFESLPVSPPETIEQE